MKKKTFSQICAENTRKKSNQKWKPIKQNFHWGSECDKWLCFARTATTAARTTWECDCTAIVKVHREWRTAQPQSTNCFIPLITSTSHFSGKSYSGRIQRRIMAASVTAARTLFSGRFCVTNCVSIDTTTSLFASAPRRAAPRSGVRFVSSDRSPFRKRRRAEALFLHEIKLIGWRLWDRWSRQRLDVCGRRSSRPTTSTQAHTQARALPPAATRFSTSRRPTNKRPTTIDFTKSRFRTSLDTDWRISVSCWLKNRPWRMLIYSSARQRLSCGRLKCRPHYASWRYVCPSLPYEHLTRKQKKA